jgi:hypothetical protein
VTSEASSTQGRVDGRRYCELPEGHRTTLVVGMLDMFERMADYLGSRERAAFEPMLEYARGFESGKMRQMFDEYMRSDPTSKSCAISSNLLSMLIVKSGTKIIN